MTKRALAVLQATLLLVPTFARATSKKSAMRIKVLDSETRSSVLDDSGVPKNCDGLNYDAYCHSTATTQVTNILAVQEDDGPVFRVACTVDSRWSRCTALPKGESFDARKEKHGITIYYRDDDDKPRKQLYVLFDEPQNAASPLSAEVNPPVSKLSPAANGAAPGPQNTVRCTFDSTPRGAEIDLDGQFVGSTPSTLNLTVGTHVVVISMPAFRPWKRQLAITPGSVLEVNAPLQPAP